MIHTDDQRSDNDALIEIAKEAAGIEVLDPDTLYASATPQHVIDLEKHLDVPRRKRGTASLATAASLTDYVVRHRASDAVDVAENPVAIYADQTKARVVAVLNDATRSEPGWGDHQAWLTLQPTDAWQHWISIDGKLVSQVDFAEHIEAGLLEIVDPPAAEMLELALTFEAKQSVAFKTAHRLEDGARQLNWEETIDARAGQKGSITIPKEFQLRVAPYEGSNSADIVARLRYRISDGRLGIGYVLVRPNDVLRAAFEQAIEDIEAGTQVAVFAGSPPVRL